MSEVGGLTRPPPPAPALDSARAAGPSPPLAAAVGNVVEVEVVSAGGPEGLLVRVGGQLVRALGPDALTTGLRTALRVESLGPPLVLGVPEPPSGELGRLVAAPPAGLSAAVQTLLSASDEGVPFDGRAALQGLRQLLALPASPPALAVALRSLWEASGLFHEHHLAQGAVPGDLKTLALRLLAHVPEEAPLARAALDLLGHIQSWQARSLLQGDPVMVFSLAWGGAQESVELVVEREGTHRKSGGGSAGGLRLRLEMPALGPVEVRLRWGEAGIAVRFAAGPAGAQRIRESLGELASSLEQVPGLRLRAVEVKSLAAAGPRSGAGVVDVTA